MSRLFNFEIQFGQIFIEAEKSKLDAAHEMAWAQLTNIDLPYEEWVIVFNLLGPMLAREIKSVAPNAPARMIAEYSKTLGENDPDVLYMTSLSDETSQLTHVLRARFEVIIKVARGNDASSDSVIQKGLGEIKSVFARLPKYCLTSVRETLLIYQAR